MYYPDLSFYRTGGNNNTFEIYPNVKNIGWLDKEYPFSKGKLPTDLVKKLKELIFLDIKNQDDIKNMCFNENSALIVDQMSTRGSAYQCSFCNDEVINVSPNGLEMYSGERIKVLGLNEICIPSVDGGMVYSCPTLIYHYIVNHDYMPPSEFIDALSSFDLNKPYNSNKDKAFEYCVDVPASKVDSLTANNVNNYPVSED